MRDCGWHRQIALVLSADDLRRSDEEQRTARKVYRSRDEAKAYIAWSRYPALTHGLSQSLPGEICSAASKRLIVHKKIAFSW